MEREISTPAGTPRFKGVPVTLAETTYIVPPLALKDMKVLLPRIRSMEVTPDGVPLDLDVLLDVATAAIKRNYPSITLAELEEIVDVSNMAQLAEACFGAAAGFTRRTGGAASPGEATSP